MKSNLPRLFRRISSSLGISILVVSFASMGTSLFFSLGRAEAQGSPKSFLHRDNPLVRKAIEVQIRHTERLMGIQDVVGTGVGIGPDGRPVIKVLTARGRVAGIPKSLESIPVQVSVTGLFIAYSDPTSRFDRPVPIGVSTGHPDITAGTIGARVKDRDNNLYALSNNHVYANQNDATIGDSALQPGPYDGGIAPVAYQPGPYEGEFPLPTFTVNYDKIGELYDFEPIDFSIFGTNTIDAAIASTNMVELGNATPPEGYGTPNSTIFGDLNGDDFFDNKNDLLNLPVQKFGRTTGLTHGQVSEINVTAITCYANCSNPFFGQYAWFEDQIAITSDNTGAFSAGGDSGSLIVTNDANKNPVGLLFAGSNTRTLANRIDLVLNRFGVSIDGSIEWIPPSPPE